MNKIKQLMAMMFMACGMVMSMASCDKESTEDAADIVGSWRLAKVELLFDGELIATDKESDVLVFTEDGIMYYEDDDEEIEYIYSPKSKELTLIDSFGQEVISIERLTSSELVISETISDIFGLNYIDYSSIGEAVDKFNGYRIYEYNHDGESLYCYKKDGKYCLCEELEDGGYFDTQAFCYKRIK